MKLTLAIEGKILASIPIEPCKEQNDDYLKALRRLLLLRHQQKIKALKKEPIFSFDHTDERRKTVLVA